MEKALTDRMLWFCGKRFFLHISFDRYKGVCYTKK